jgi:tRNA pseudouridine55 synthase
MHIEPPEGFLVVDKPAGCTSRDVVNRAQRWFPRRTPLGHTGTLDPLATGVLVLAVGTATRLTEYVQDMDKVYRAGLRLGARSDTDDADGTVTPVVVDRPPDEEAVRAGLRELTGEIEQVPPTYSAAKLTGRRAYDLARQGEAVDLQPRRVRVYAIDLLFYSYPNLEMEVRCGKGTYIRSLARDLGRRLGCGALVEQLRRTRIGAFRVTDAIGMDADAATARARLLPLAAAVAELPKLTVDREALLRLQNGAALSLETLPVRPAGLKESRRLAVFDGNDRLALVAAVDWQQRLVQPRKVFRDDSND